MYESDTIDRPAAQSEDCGSNTHPGSAAIIRSMVNRNLQSVISSESSVAVEYAQDIVTLRGHFATAKDQNRALRVAISNPCVAQVINKASGPSS